jgi:hypothetical protein
MIFQDLQDRAVGRGSPDCARGGEPLQRALHALEVADPLLDDFDLLSGFPLDDIAGSAVSDPQGEQLLDFLQREAEFLGMPDEAEARHRVVGVLTVPGRGAPRCGDEAAPLVVTYGLNFTSAAVAIWLIVSGILDVP